MTTINLYKKITPPRPCELCWINVEYLCEYEKHKPSAEWIEKASMNKPQFPYHPAVAQPLMERCRKMFGSVYICTECACKNLDEMVCTCDICRVRTLRGSNIFRWKRFL